jgi:hypothetical protein
MINISSYILFNLSNLIFIVLLPSNFLKVFLINFSIASGIFSYLALLIFSNTNFKLSEKYVICVGFLNLLFFILYPYNNLNSLYIWMYSAIIIYADYYFSQNDNFKINFLIKLILFLLSFLLFIDNISPILVIQIKILFLIIFISIFFLKKNNSCKILRIKKPNLYVLSTCIVYYGTLFMIAYFFNPVYMKLIYIVFQIFLSFHLKIFDLKIRKILSLSLNYKKLLFTVSLTLFILLSYYYNNYYIMSIYIICYLFLNYVEKKFL